MRQVMHTAERATQPARLRARRARPGELDYNARHNKGKALFFDLGGSQEQGVPDFNREAAPDVRPAPAVAVPGSEAKILLMQDRAARGYAIFNDNDPTCFDLPDAEVVGLLQPPHCGRSRRVYRTRVDMLGDP
jgi:hypothetical protein